MPCRTSLLRCLAVLLAAGAMAGGCTSTKIVDTWRDPAQTGPLDFQRVLVVVLANDAYARNVAEDTLVERIGRGRAVAAHNMFSETERSDARKFKYELSKGTFDGVVTMGIVGRRRGGSGGAAENVEEPMYNYYGRAAASTSEGYPEKSDIVYRVETRIFTARNERLVWAAVSDTGNPQDARQLVIGVAKAVGAELRRQKLIR